MQKYYSRLQQLPLPTPGKLSDGLRTLIRKRSSFRNFSETPLDFSTLSDILFYSAGVMRPNPTEIENPFRAYPSGGAKYPLEIYPLILSGKGIQQGLYHYSPLSHSLDVLLQPIFPKELDGIWTTQEWFRKAAAIIILTAIFHRTTNKYGERGIKFPYIEAGHLAQNIHLLATSLDLGCCSIGLLNEDALVKLLDINPRDEYPIYSIALGN